MRCIVVAVAALDVVAVAVAGNGVAAVGATSLQRFY